MDDLTSVLEEQKEKRRREMTMRNLKGMNEYTKFHLSSPCPL
jgi:hypothetical protein